MGDEPKTIHDRVRDYLPYLQSRMRLEDWTIEVSEDEAQTGAMADVGVMSGRKVAQIRLCRSFADKDPAEQRHAMVHELTHVHVFRMLYAAEGVRGYMSPREFKFYLKGLYREMEYAVDAMADWSAPLLATMQELEDEGD